MRFVIILLGIYKRRHTVMHRTIVHNGFSNFTNKKQIELNPIAVVNKYLNHLCNSAVLYFQTWYWPEPDDSNNRNSRFAKLKYIFVQILLWFLAKFFKTSKISYCHFCLSLKNGEVHIKIEGNRIENVICDSFAESVKFFTKIHI